MRQRPRPWPEAWAEALLGDGGFYTRESPKDHFRTSANLDPESLARVALRLLQPLQADSTGSLSFLDIGGGHAEVATALADLAADHGLSADSLEVCVLEVRPCPESLDERVTWWRGDALTTLRASAPRRGLSFAHEWLDTIPVSISEVDREGWWREVLVELDGVESFGERIEPTALPPGTRRENNALRCAAWRIVVSAIAEGAAVAVDYTPSDPLAATLTGYRDGVQVPPIPDGTSDLTAHVDLPAVAASIEATHPRSRLLRQHEVFSRLGVASSADIVDPGGLGSMTWLITAVGSYALDL